MIATDDLAMEYPPPLTRLLFLRLQLFLSHLLAASFGVAAIAGFLRRGNSRQAILVPFEIPKILLG